MPFIVKVKACCPTRYQLLRVEAETEKEAREKALKHCNGNRLTRRGWAVLKVRETT